MSEFRIKPQYTLDDVPLLMKCLRDPVTGCPWDKTQTHESIRQDLIEETYEAVEAIDRENTENLKEELGDMLMNIALHAEIEREKGVFDLDDVADALCKKMVLRHPHVFGDIIAEDSDAVLKNWEEIKRGEKKQKTGSDAIDDVPKAYPALIRSQKVQKRAAYTGFDYRDINEALADLESEISEFKKAINGDGDPFEELGDILFSAVNVARFIPADSELALTRACEKFAERFRIVEDLAAERGIDMKKSDLDQLNMLWAESKKTEGEKEK
ncbi:MAG: nucleoside triphosphate pyrophosphohydrolase [Oscillospiraceae bacterium]|jgi:tetrapyrrole methylase family protein/MazG family protein|nr:nucleoside triphosphate pyrophosphohydrolase [Oscillospiraceae bacterium]MBQ4240864.1 nucleoside triphosphate pyrophosphohydrolase [Oscillospiraceae bacterium]